MSVNNNNICHIIDLYETMVATAPTNIFITVADMNMISLNKHLFEDNCVPIILKWTNTSNTINASKSNHHWNDFFENRVR